MFGGIFSEHWIDGRRCGPLRRRHSGKGRAVPERCPSISVLPSSLPAGMISRVSNAEWCLGYHTMRVRSVFAT